MSAPQMVQELVTLTLRSKRLPKCTHVKESVRKVRERAVNTVAGEARRNQCRGRERNTKKVSVSLGTTAIGITSSIGKKLKSSALPSLMCAFLLLILQARKTRRGTRNAEGKRSVVTAIPRMTAPVTRPPLAQTRKFPAAPRMLTLAQTTPVKASPVHAGVGRDAGHRHLQKDAVKRPRPKTKRPLPPLPNESAATEATPWKASWKVRARR